MTIFLFLCVFCFVLKQGTVEKTNGQKKKLNGQQNTLRDIRPSLIRQNKPPLLLSAQDLCFFSFLSSSLQRRAQQLILSIYKDLLVGLSVFRYTKCERLNFDAIGTKAGTLRCVARSFWDEQKRERDPLLHLYCVSSGWDFLIQGCLVYLCIYIGSISRQNSLSLSLSLSV